MKRIICFTIAVLMFTAFLAAGLSAAANQAPVDISATGQINIILKHNSALLSGFSLRLYRVASIDEDGVYELTEPFEDVDLGDLTLESIADGSDYDTNERLTDIFVRYLATHSSISPDETAVTGSDGSALLTNLPLGMYLLTQSGAATATHIIEPLLIPLPLLQSDGSWLYALEGGPKTEPRTPPTTTPPTTNPPTTTPPPTSTPYYPYEPYDPYYPPPPSPPPRPPGNLIPDGDGYIDVDLNEPPLSPWDPPPKWEWDPEEEEWTIVPPDVPLTEFLPQTGLTRWPVPVLLGLGALLFIGGMYMTLGKNAKMSARRIGVLLLTVGVVSIVSSGMYWLNNSSEESEAGGFSQHTARAFVESMESTGAGADVQSALDGRIRYLMIDGTAYIGILNIPSLNLNLPVNATWSYPALRQTPCRYSGSIEDNSLVIAAHSYRTHFGNIGSLALGELMTLTDAEGVERQYEVVKTEVVAPTSVDEVMHSEYDLTLFSCTYSGQSRVVVRCMLVSEIRPDAASEYGEIF